MFSVHKKLWPLPKQSDMFLSNRSASREREHGDPENRIPSSCRDEGRSPGKSISVGSQEAGRGLDGWREEEGQGPRHDPQSMGRAGGAQCLGWETSKGSQSWRLPDNSSLCMKNMEMLIPSQGRLLIWGQGCQRTGFTGLGQGGGRQTARPGDHTEEDRDGELENRLCFGKVNGQG